MARDIRFVEGMAGAIIGDEVFVPIADRVVVQLKEAPEKIGSLYVPETSQDRLRACKGVVLAVGPGRRDEKGQSEDMTVLQPDGTVRPLRPGDIVQFGQFAGQRMKDIEDKELPLVILFYREIHGAWHPAPVFVASQGG